MAMVVKKLLVDNKIAACVKHTVYLLGVTVRIKFQIYKNCLVKHFALLKNVCNQYLNFVI